MVPPESDARGPRGGVARRRSAPSAPLGVALPVRARPADEYAVGPDCPGCALGLRLMWGSGSCSLCGRPSVAGRRDEDAGPGVSPRADEAARCGRLAAAIHPRPELIEYVASQAEEAARALEAGALASRRRIAALSEELAGARAEAARLGAENTALRRRLGIGPGDPISV